MGSAAAAKKVRTRPVEADRVLARMTGKALGKTQPSFGSFRRKPKEADEVGACRSCGCPGARARIVPHHAGIPLLCDECHEKRRERIALNREAYYTTPRLETLYDY